MAVDIQEFIAALAEFGKEGREGFDRLNEALEVHEDEDTVELVFEAIDWLKEVDNAANGKDEAD